ncbi:MAG: hypothetical protein QHH75_13705 [Bacillota bacterium]|nr:hypothetical protein [Bacillota bacterium]
MLFQRFFRALFRQEILLFQLLCLALVLRFYVVVVQGPSLELASDDIMYRRSAGILVAYHRFTTFDPDRSSAYVMPGYPLFLSIFYILPDFLPRELLIRIAQGLLSVLQLFFIGAIARRLELGYWGLLALGVAALYPPLVALPGYFLTESLFGLLVTAAVYCSLDFFNRPILSTTPSGRRTLLWHTCLLGLLCGFTALVRPTILPLPVLCLGVIFLRSGEGRAKTGFLYRLFERERRRLGFVLLLCFCLPLLPWWMRNAVVFQQFIPLSSEGGSPLLLGTYPKGLPQGYAPDWPYSKNEMEMNRARTELAWQRIKAGFTRETGNYLYYYLIRKPYFLWIVPFYPRSVLGIAGSHLLLFQFAVFVLAVLGAALLVLSRQGAGVFLTAFLAAYTLEHMVYFSYGRYGLPLLPLVFLLATLPLQRSAAALVKFRRMIDLRQPPGGNGNTGTGSYFSCYCLEVTRIVCCRGYNPRQH